MTTGTLAVIEYLADNVANEPVLVVLATRPDGVAGLSGPIDRRSATMVAVPRLGDADVATMTRSCLGDAARTGPRRSPLLPRTGVCMLFDSWEDLLRILAVGPMAYIALVVMLRTSGARTLSKLNAFDLVVTVALGSTLATALLDTTVSLAEGALALLSLVLLQYVVSRSSLRWPALERIVKSEPVLLYHRGFQQDRMRRARVTEAEVRQAARGSGKASLDDVVAVVLETDGSLSILTSVPDLPDHRD